MAAPAPDRRREAMKGHPKGERRTRRHDYALCALAAVTAVLVVWLIVFVTLRAAGVGW